MKRTLRKESQRVLEIVGREADGGGDARPVIMRDGESRSAAFSGAGVDAGPRATQARRMIPPADRRLCDRGGWRATSRTCPRGTCARLASASGLPIRPVLKHGPRSLTCVRVGRCGCFVEPCHGIESSKWAIFGKQNWRCGMNRKPGYGAQLRANLEPTKGVGRLRQQDGGHGSRNPLRKTGEARKIACITRTSKGNRVKIPEPDVAVGGNVKGVRRRRRGPREELSFLFNSLPTLETAQPEVGSSGWKSTARRVVSGAPPAALENPEDRVPPTPGRTHNRIRSPRQGKSAKWIRNFGKRIGSEGWARGSQSRTRRLSVDCSSCSRGESGSSRAGRGTDWERPLWGPSPGVEQPTQNWYGQGESDCLIKTKHCDGPCGCSRNVISAQCSECQSEEIQPSAVGGGALPPPFVQRLRLGRADPGRHCQVGSLAGAAHLLKDNAAPCRTDSSLPPPVPARSVLNTSRKTKTLSRRGSPLGRGVAVPSHPRQPAGLASPRESSQVPVVLGAKRGRGGAGAPPRPAGPTRGAEARGHSRHAKESGGTRDAAKAKGPS
ncbi:hypothetical protein H6P81_021735 [Aristolochia fimbriata]|uniref:Uncharacterized protein n=1 Tax=Aristolochia fimbriata TaxID=158543 RepID=A0AAV7DQ68_ARIFI|nr:hypothetical protein H6P81_021735 [Aristolochia fimbriata]